jgi:hypothetical protein
MRSRAPKPTRGSFAALCASSLAIAAFLLPAAIPAAAADEACPNEALRAETHSGALPDCRAYEMVSPPSKNGADVMAQGTRTRVAADGSAVSFTSLTGFGDIAGSGIAFEYMSNRDGAPGTNGWSTHGITPLQEPLSDIDLLFAGLEPLYVGDFTADLSTGVYMSKTPLTSDGANVAKVVNLYRRDDLRDAGPGDYSLITDCPACTGPLALNDTVWPMIAGGSADLSSILFESRFKLTADAPGNCANPDDVTECPAKLYKWSDGVVTLEGILPDGTPAPSSMAGRGAGATQRVTGALYTPHVISEDGSRAIFTTPASLSEMGDVYVRENDSTTVQVNASERHPADTAQPAEYWDATPDGSQVFFTSAEQLTDDDTNSNVDLYRFDLDAPQGSRLTRLSDASSGGVAGVLGTSEDGSYVYFLAQRTRIFVWHDGVVHHVADVSNSDAAPIIGRNGWRLPANRKFSRVSPDGTHLLFTTEGSGVTTYDNSGCNDSNGAGCYEVYVYDATANGGNGAVVCASCDPSGAPAVSDATISANFGIGATAVTSHITHPLSDDGRYAFFDTEDALVPSDTNATRDAYEYDTQTGQVHLLTSGTSPTPSFFMDASANGKDVFVDTRERLVGWDPDQNYDLYDVRVNGGFPEPVVPAPCEGSSCRPAPKSPPLATGPGSLSLEGPGNPIIHRKKHPKKHKRRHRQSKKQSANRNHR